MACTEPVYSLAELTQPLLVSERGFTQLCSVRGLRESGAQREPGGKLEEEQTQESKRNKRSRSSNIVAYPLMVFYFVD